MPVDQFQEPRRILSAAVIHRAFPAAVVEVGTRDRLLWSEAFGTLTWEPDAAPADRATIFDLASLTKVIATTTLAMRLVDVGHLGLDEPIRARIADWRGLDREDVVLRDLLAHCSGLTAWLPLFRDHSGRAEIQRTISTLALEYAPRSRAIYSDLGFMVAGFIVEDGGGAPLRHQFQRLMERVVPAGDHLAFDVPAALRARTAPTEVDPWRGRLLAGEVHDENAWALGGAAGHAGLFGTTRAVGAFAQMMLSALQGEATAWLAEPAIINQFVTPSPIPGSSRALGWDTMRPTSSCGTLMSASAIGHTGFTGTSLWIDPSRGIYVVLLTNRVHPSRSNDRIREVRPALHDAVMRAIE